jgi:hypothetical protein
VSGWHERGTRQRHLRGSRHSVHACHGSLGESACCVADLVWLAYAAEVLGQCLHSIDDVTSIDIWPCTRAAFHPLRAAETRTAACYTVAVGE